MVNMDHTCTGTKSSSWTEMEGEKSRSLELSCPIQQTKAYLLTQEQVPQVLHIHKLTGEGKGSSKGACT